jgi:hypothetical protein
MPAHPELVHSCLYRPYPAIAQLLAIITKKGVFRELSHGHAFGSGE